MNHQDLRVLRMDIRWDHQAHQDLRVHLMHPRENKGHLDLQDHPIIHQEDKVDHQGHLGDTQGVGINLRIQTRMIIGHKIQIKGTDLLLKELR